MWSIAGGSATIGRHARSSGLPSTGGSRETTRQYRDRTDAGEQLATALRDICSNDVVVVGLPRGGVPVAAAVARSLVAPLDVIIVRKLGAPRQPELAMGAVGEDGVSVVNERVVRVAGVTVSELERAIEVEQAEIVARAHRFRDGRDRTPLEGRTAVIVDDGLATGATARAACLVARGHGAARIIVAVPVAPRRALAKLADVADETVCLSSPAGFYAVGQAYRHFEPTSDEEVIAILRRAADPSLEES